MKLPSYFRSCLIGGIGITLLAGARAEETTSSIKFSDPDKPGTMKIALARGDLHIQSGKAENITIQSEAQTRARTPRKDGLRVLTEAASFSLTEKDNVVTLDAVSDGWLGSPADFRITVPANTNVVISNTLGGDITCFGVTGDIEVKSINGVVRLDGVVGSALVETMNGEINATIRELHENKPLSFTSMNGEVGLRLPSDAKANIRLRTQNGTIATDFDAKALVTQVEAAPAAFRTAHGERAILTPEIKESIRDAIRGGVEVARHAAEAAKEAADAAREGLEDSGELPRDDGRKHLTTPRTPAVPHPPVPPMPAIPTITGGKLVTGTLNGGGPEINVATMNGDVTLRRLDNK